jgi:cobalamin biosynthesis protein CobD/CbiB
LYRLSLLLKAKWGGKVGAAHGDFGQFAAWASFWIDWLPLRLTAVGFAVVGNFEDAVYCWRNQASRWRDPETGIVLAAGAGAIGVKLGKPVHDGVGAGGVAFDDRIEIGTGIDADAAFLSSTVGLVWRALVLWMLLLAMLAVANWV